MLNIVGKSFYTSQFIDEIGKFITPKCQVSSSVVTTNYKLLKSVYMSLSYSKIAKGTFLSN